MDELLCEEAEVNVWKSNLSNLIEQTEGTLKEVSQVLFNINNISAGPMVDKLVEFGDKFHETFGDLIKAFHEVVSLMEDLVKKLKDWAMEKAEEVAESLGKFIGGAIVK